MNVKLRIIFTFLAGILVSCSNKNLEIRADSPKIISPTPSTPKPQQPPEAKSKKIYPWVYQVGFEKIDPDLVAEGEKLKISYVKEYETSPNDFCVFDVKYPQISGLKDLALQEQINYQLWVEITKIAYQDFQKILLEQQYNQCQGEVTKGKTSKESKEYYRHYRRRISIDRPCQIKYAQKSLVSLICKEWRMPGAYPLKYGRGATFNLRNGEFYDTPWRPNLDYQRDIDPYFYKVVKSDGGYTEIFSAKSNERMAIYLIAGNDFYIADECENLENTFPPFSPPKDLSKSTCIIFVNVGSGADRNRFMSITTDEVKAILREEIAEIIN